MAEQTFWFSLGQQSPQQGTTLEPEVNVSMWTCGVRGDGDV